MRNVPNFAAYTLIEFVIVVALLAMIAAVATPSLHSDRDVKLDRAAAEIAAAIRFAKSEALRTGTGHGVTINQTTQQVTVNSYDLSTVPVSLLSTLTHPVTKQPYDFNVSTAPGTRGVIISNSDDIFDYVDIGPRQTLLFDPEGTPIWILGTGPAAYMLAKATIELGYENHDRAISVAPLTGRVTIQ